MIVKANLACWRRSLLSPGRIERGRYTCWNFVVKHSNGTAHAQHDDLPDFPFERDGCETEESCGLEEWPCRIGRLPSIVSLHWQFPISETIYCIIGVAASLIFAVMAVVRYIRDGKKRNDDEDDDDDHGDNETVFDDGLDTAGSKYERSKSNRVTSSMSLESPEGSNSDSTVPFTFRKRMPTWMQHRSPHNRESASAMQFPTGHSP